MAVLDQVIEVVAKQLGRDPSEFNAASDLEAEGYESLDVIEMIFAIEETFDIEISFNANDADAMQMRTIGEIAATVEQALAKKNGAAAE